MRPSGGRGPGTARRNASQPSSPNASPPTTPACATTRTSGTARGEHFSDELMTDLALSCAMWLGMGRMLRTLDIGQSLQDHAVVT